MNDTVLYKLSFELEENIKFTDFHLSTVVSMVLNECAFCEIPDE